MNPYPNDPLLPDPVFVTLLLVYAVFLLWVLVFSVGYYVVMALALSRFFVKVGVEPWIAWVPFYSTWKWLEVGGIAGWFALLSLVPYGGFATSAMLCIAMYRSGVAFRKDGSWVVLGFFLPFVWAFFLARPQESYEPELIVQVGYPRPLAGFGAA